jgi:RNA-directed DNA polymerase
LALIETFLKAGVMEGGLFQRTELGAQQGGILSPLLSNVYLHQFDLWWWKTYGSLSRYEKRKRRRQGLGHPILLRYADDWLLLWSGDKAGAVALKEEAKTFLEQELKLKLNESKTMVTHVDDGYTFLGFDIRRYPGTKGKPVVLIKPSQKSIDRFKAKIKALTDRSTTCLPAWQLVKQLNPILMGWSAYYQYVNAKAAFYTLDWWVLNRTTRWAWKKHAKPAWRVIRAKYGQRDPKGRINFTCRDDQGKFMWVYRMGDRPIRRYWVEWNRPSYADGGVVTIAGESDETISFEQFS